MAPNEKSEFSQDFKSKIETASLWPNSVKKSHSTYTRSPYNFDPCPKTPLVTQIGVYFCHMVIICMGFVAELLRYYRLIGTSSVLESEKQKDFAPLGNTFEAMFSNNIYKQGSDIVNRPLTTAPSTEISIQEREFGEELALKLTGKTQNAMNFGSYNYLGLSQTIGTCADATCAEIEKRGLCTCASDYESEVFPLQRQLENQVTRFLGTESALCFPNGFGINTAVLPRLANRNTLIMSDKLNHSSLLVGMQASGGTVVIFDHNDMLDLEVKLKNALVKNLSTTSTFKKILIVVEGIYSMEGTIVNLPRLIEIKQKYKAYLFIDEAHSIGAIGQFGRGITDYWECDAKYVDVLMGTFTKSFGSAGGYITGRKHIIDNLRMTVPSRFYSSSLSPPLIGQIIASMKIMMGEDGTEIGIEKNQRLIQNIRYFRQKLKDMNFIIYGHEDTAIISVLSFYMPKTILFGREALKRGLAICCVGYPAVPLNKSRVRFCINSEHTKSQMDKALEIISICGDLTNIKYTK